MEEVAKGIGPLFTDPDPDRARDFFRQKNRTMVDKTTSVRRAVEELVRDGDYLASGGFGTNRIPAALLHEVLRQAKRNLGFAGHTTTHDFQLVVAGNRNGEKMLSRLDCAYAVGLEARGLSPQARRVLESGQVEVCEWSNYALAVRLKAAAMGVPFLPVRSVQGTDTFHHSAAQQITCPFTGHKLAALPALYPDVGLIHVHESDKYGNCRIWGSTVADAELARASKRLIVSTERLVSDQTIRQAPYATVIPCYCVDAVCHVPGGSYPGNMPGEYYSDEEHLRRWLEVERDEAAYGRFLEEHIYGVKDFAEYIERCGGAQRLAHLRQVELLEVDQ